MHTYNAAEKTVTLTWDEYRDLVANQRGTDDNADLSFNELDVFAFNLMDDEDRSDYELSVAVQWLEYRCKSPVHFGEWCAMMRDLEYQLQQIYRNSIKEDN